MSGVRRGKGLFYGIKFASRHERESTLSALYAFAGKWQRFERISQKQERKKKQLNDRAGYLNEV